MPTITQKGACCTCCIGAYCFSRTARRTALLSLKFVDSAPSLSGRACTNRNQQETDSGENIKRVGNPVIVCSRGPGDHRSVYRISPPDVKPETKITVRCVVIIPDLRQVCECFEHLSYCLRHQIGRTNTGMYHLRLELHHFVPKIVGLERQR